LSLLFLECTRRSRIVPDVIESILLQLLERCTDSYLAATSAAAIEAHPFVNALYRSDLVDGDMDENQDKDPPVKMSIAGMIALIDELFFILIRTELGLYKLDPGHSNKVWLCTAWEEDVIPGGG
jgi:hypothetical protein